MSASEEKTSQPLWVTEYGRWLAHPPPAGEVVISGVAGSFPESNGLHELFDNLMNKVDMVTDDERRWKRHFYFVPQRSGKVKCIEQFDAAFFGRCYNEAEAMGPMTRLLCERATEAVIDAGVSPASLEGTRLGVYVGLCFDETDSCTITASANTKYGIKAASRVFLAASVCRAFKAIGPAYLTDTACSSTFHSLNDAYKDLREGRIDAAIVAGCNLTIISQSSAFFYRLGVLSEDGRCKVFDENADGYARAETVACVFLQRTADAKRVYCTVVHVVSNCDGYKDTSITFPSASAQRELLTQVIAEADIHPKDVVYIETHGTGTKVGDPVEMEALDKYFGKHHSPDSPLLIGSVKSNIGHTEAAAGVCSLAKIILAMETGIIPANINYNTPRKEIIGLMEKRFKVVTEALKTDCKLSLVSSFGFGGSNSNVLLRWNPKVKANADATTVGIPRLVIASGRSVEATRQLLNNVSSKWPLDGELVSLIHNVFSKSLPGHTRRGYVLVGDKGVISTHIKACALTRELWFLLPGLGSVWPGMGRQLMDIPPFASTIESCHEATSQLGIDLKRLITSSDVTFDDIAHSLLATVAMQLGLLSVLKVVGAKPCGVIGCSVGELAAACADGCISTHEAMLLAFHMAQSLSALHVEPCTTAIVEMETEKLSEILPPGIDISMRNAVDKCIITGSTEKMGKFLFQLQGGGVSAREINWWKIPIHSAIFKRSSSSMNDSLDKVLPSLPRCPKLWKSASGRVPSSSPRHFWRALSEPVDLSRLLLELPVDAVLLEVSADSLISSQLDNPCYGAFTLEPLMQKGCTATVDLLLTALGRLYANGIQVDPSTLYSATQQPASRGTLMIAPSVQWSHLTPWRVHNEMDKYRDVYWTTIEYVLTAPANQFYLGHVIDGRKLFPATGYLFTVIEWITKVANFAANNCIFTFENVRFDRATTVQEDGKVVFLVVMHKKSGEFEIIEGGASVVSGKVSFHSATGSSPLSPFQPPPEGTERKMTSKDVYKELRLRGYNYTGLFRSVHSLDCDGFAGKLKWQDNLVAFMDNMLQLKILSQDTRNLYVPTSITKCIIDLRKHYMVCDGLNEDKLCAVYYDPKDDTIRTEGIEIKGLRARPIPRKKIYMEPVLETHQFVPHTSPGLSTSEMCRFCVHLALENNSQCKRIQALEIASSQPLLAREIMSVLADLPLVQHDITVVVNLDHPDVKSLGTDMKVCPSLTSAEAQDCLVVIASDLLGDSQLFNKVLQRVVDGGFIFSRESSKGTGDLSHENLEIIAEQSSENEKIVIWKKVCEEKKNLPPVVIRVTGVDLNWLPDVQAALVGPKRKVVLFAQSEPTNGLLGLYNCIAKEGYDQKISCFFIMDERAPKFSTNSEFYREQLKKDLAVNVYRDGAWGSYRHLLLGPPTQKPLKHVFNCATTIGDLSSLTWLQGPLDVRLSDPSMEVVQVVYSALNFRDIMGATGRLSVDVLEKCRLRQECIQGLEFSGFTAGGERVMGMAPSGALATLLEYKNSYWWTIPNNWTLAEAATVPIAYLTVVYAFKRGQLRRGESVLIHSGSGGVGQAAIHYCLFHGCQVFATVGTQEKRDFLLQRFPQLSPDHIGNSRDTSFEQLIERQTSGRGVDVVLNSLAEDKLLASLRCLATGGRFLEIGKFDLANNTMLAASMFSKDQSFHVILLDEFFYNPECTAYCTNLLQEALDEGSVAPLTQIVYQTNEVETAFRFMASGKHIGKVLIRVQEDNNYKKFDRKTPLMRGQPRIYFNPQNSYIIIGGLGGFGLELADWMIVRGARKVVLVSRRGVSTGYQAYRIRLWKQYGINILVSTCDVGTRKGVQQLLQDASSLGPVAGVFNLAVVLKDAGLENQTPEKFGESMYPKAVATRLLDEETRRECPDLQHFVVFSSVSCGRGNAGQTNYGYGNSVMERICEARARDGLPALAIQWGAIGEVGLVADMQDNDQQLVIGGTLQQPLSSCLNVLDRFMTQKCPVVASMVVAEKKASAGSKDDDITSVIAGILGLRDLKMINFNLSLPELGMDSMMAVEIKQVIEQHFDVFFTQQDIRNMTLAKLMEMDSSSAEPEKADEYEQYLSLVFGEEAAASDPVLPMPSASSGQNPSCTVFVVPGVEGTAAALLPLASLLRAKVFGLQYGCSEETPVPDIAHALLQQILHKLSPGEQFILIGYSYGGVVAMEIALALEAAGFRGKLILLDSSPSFTKELMMRLLKLEKDDSEATIQNKTVACFITNISNWKSASVEKAMISIKEQNSWEDRVRLFMSEVPSSPYSPAFQLQRLNAMLAHIKALLNYQWPKSERIKSPVVLLRPTQSGISYKIKDYCLSQNCEKEVRVHFVEGNHLSMLTNSDCANIINAELQGS